MAQVDIEEIIDYLDTEMRSALRDAVNEVDSNANIDEYELFRAFKRAVRRKCSTWESVPEQYVRE